MFNDLNGLTLTRPSIFSARLAIFINVKGIIRVAAIISPLRRDDVRYVLKSIRNHVYCEKMLCVNIRPFSVV